MPLAVVVALLALAAAAATIATPGIHSVPIPRPGISEMNSSHAAVLRSAGITESTTPPPAHVTAVPDWLKHLVTYTLIGLVIAVFAFLAWRLVLMGITSRAERVHRA